MKSRDRNKWLTRLFSYIKSSYINSILNKFVEQREFIVLIKCFINLEPLKNLEPRT